jgi:hypothetical protein
MPPKKTGRPLHPHPHYFLSRKQTPAQSGFLPRLRHYIHLVRRLPRDPPPADLWPRNCCRTLDHLDLPRWVPWPRRHCHTPNRLSQQRIIVCPLLRRVLLNQYRRLRLRDDLAQLSLQRGLLSRQ